MPLAKDRNTPQQEGSIMVLPVKAATTIYAGALVCVSATGYAQPGAVAITLTAAGRAEERVVNAGADGDVSIRVRKGRFRFKNSAAGDLITIADFGKSAYVVDDETVAKTNGGNTRSVAGTIRGVDAQGVWIEF